MNKGEPSHDRQSQNCRYGSDFFVPRIELKLPLLYEIILFMAINKFEEELKGGHHNSLGNTVKVVEEVLSDQDRLQDLIDCWKSHDELVRLRVQNGVKRVAKEQPKWVAEFLPDLLSWITDIDQASTKWCLSTLYVWLDEYMTNEQRKTAIEIMKDNIHYNDWIVQNTTSESLAYYAKKDAELRQWLIPELEDLSVSKHKSVSNRAKKLIDALSE
jgi:hypothetical protein